MPSHRMKESAMRSHSLHMLIVLSVALCMAVGTLSSQTMSRKTEIAMTAPR